MPYKTLNREYKFRAWMDDHMIYEGDIIKDDDKIGIVEWQLAGFHVGYIDNTEGDFTYGYNADIEIIGSIYENPELLNDKVTNAL